jgi:hypothetical protein
VGDVGRGGFSSQEEEEEVYQEVEWPGTNLDKRLYQA